MLMNLIHVCCHWNSQKTPHISPFRASYGVSFMSISTEIDRVIKGFYCTWYVLVYCTLKMSTFPRGRLINVVLYIIQKLTAIMLWQMLQASHCNNIGICLFIICCWKHQELIITTHLLSIEHADWSKQLDVFKARDAKIWQREFPVGFPV